MADPIGALARLFKRKPKNTLVGELYSRGIGRPLLAHADMGALVLKGFLSNPDIAESQASEDMVDIVAGIAVLDVSGALVSRPTGYCSPLSYAEIGQSFDDSLADDNVSIIVLRLDSSGGEASGMFDLSDHIFASRGIKPIIAVVDDMAYSAAYGIASACDEIWVTRTGGVGSVGVVSYHVDVSENNKKQGVKIEYLYAGERKVDGNPHEPLADEARASMQGEINRLYDLFVSTVARNRSMSEQAVRDTQAGTFHGDQAIQAGFADKLGTFSEAINGLLNLTANTDIGITVSAELPAELPVELSTEEPIEDGSEVAPEPEAIDAGSSDIKVENTLPQVAPAVSDDNTINAKSEAELSVPQTLTTAEQAEIKAMCTAAGMSDVADDYITACTSPKQVRADLFAAVTAGEREISTAEPVLEASSGDKHVNTADVYAKRNQRNQRGK